MLEWKQKKNTILLDTKKLYSIIYTMIEPRKTLKDLSSYQTDEYLPQWRLKLDSNENIYGVNQIILNTLKNLDSKDVSLYPCYGELLDELSKRYKVEKNRLLLTNGCDEALSVIVNTYLDKDLEILSYNPTFSMPLLYAKILGAKTKQIQYSEKFVFKQEEIEKNISTDTKIVYIATPNNPTGEIVRPSVLRGILEQFKDVLFIIDCTYINFAYDVAFEDYIDLINDFDNAILLKSFSKDFALAGLRLGFCISDKSIINNLKKVASPYNVNIAAIKSGLCVIKNEEKFEQIKELNATNREFLSKGLSDFGFTPYNSQGNFILCDFGPYCDFYYEKLKKNGVIVRRFNKESPISTCLRLTVPTEGGVRYILELLKKKDLLIFDLDGVVFDVRDSYNTAIKETFKFFSGLETNDVEIAKVKNRGNMNCDWDTTKCLLEEKGVFVEIEKIIDIFQNLFFIPDCKDKEFLIDREKLLIPKETFLELSKKYDFVVFSGRLKEEALYSLKKFDIDKYFYYYITADDLPKDLLKPDPKGVLEIIEHCPCKSIKYLGDSVDDIIAGNKANVDTIGVISPGADYNIMKNNFKHLGAKYILGDILELKDFLKRIESNL